MGNILKKVGCFKISNNNLACCLLIKSKELNLSFGLLSTSALGALGLGCAGAAPPPNISAPKPKSFKGSAPPAAPAAPPNPPNPAKGSLPNPAPPSPAAAPPNPPKPAKGSFPPPAPEIFKY